MVAVGVRRGAWWCLQHHVTACLLHSSPPEILFDTHRTVVFKCRVSQLDAISLTLDSLIIRLPLRHTAQGKPFNTKQAVSEVQ
jgi:hypothetical protein